MKFNHLQLALLIRGTRLESAEATTLSEVFCSQRAHSQSLGGDSSPLSLRQLHSQTKLAG